MNQLQRELGIPDWPGWHLIGRYDSEVGSWILHHEGEALLLEIPEGLRLYDVVIAVNRLRVSLKYVTASHTHEDHLDSDLWRKLQATYKSTQFYHPRRINSNRTLSLGGEPLYIIKAPKHSPTDVVTVFRGVAMTGDIELGML